MTCEEVVVVCVVVVMAYLEGNDNGIDGREWL
jgi:hypothetical protein